MGKYNVKDKNETIELVLKEGMNNIKKVDKKVYSLLDSKFSELLKIDKKNDILEYNKFRAELLEKVCLINTSFKNNFFSKDQTKQILTEIAEHNKLPLEQKQLHAIWLGKFDQNLTDYLKIWVKSNPDFKMKLWTDPNAHLASFFIEQLKEKSKQFSEDKEKINDYYVIDKQNDFFKTYYEKDITFDKAAEEFLLKNNLANKNDIDEALKNAKDSFLLVQQEIAKFTNNHVIISDCSKYYQDVPHAKQDLYLRQHLPAITDILRYKILEQEGGVYFDPDILPMMKIIVKDNPVLSEMFSNDAANSTGQESFTEKDRTKALKHFYDINKITKKYYIYTELDKYIMAKLLNSNNSNYETELAPYFDKIIEPITFNNVVKLSDIPNYGIDGLGISAIKPIGTGNDFLISKQNSNILKDLNKKVKENYDFISNFNCDLKDGELSAKFDEMKHKIQYHLLEQRKEEKSMFESKKKYVLDTIELAKFYRFDVTNPKIGAAIHLSGPGSLVSTILDYTAKTLDDIGINFKQNKGKFKMDKLQLYFYKRSDYKLRSFTPESNKSSWYESFSEEDTNLAKLEILNNLLKKQKK